jgi:hypothetical protein
MKNQSKRQNKVNKPDCYCRAYIYSSLLGRLLIREKQWEHFSMKKEFLMPT